MKVRAVRPVSGPPLAFVLRTPLTSDRSIIDLVGMSRLRAQHGEHVSCGGHGSRTHEWWRRPVKIITRSVKTFTQACEDL